MNLKALTPGISKLSSLDLLSKYPDGSMRVASKAVNKKHDLHVYQQASSFFYNYAHPDEPISKIYVFLEDMDAVHKALNDQDYVYSQLNLIDILAEKCSDIDCIPPELKRLFAPQFCQCFSEFHGIENYCAYPSLRISGL